MPIETFYTVVPLILVLGFFAFTARDQTIIEAPLEDPDVSIEVYGKRWAWDFNYLNENVYSAGIQAQELPGRGVDADALPSCIFPWIRKSRSKLNLAMSFTRSGLLTSCTRRT
jgi:cytochrome c oxidase subunit 2